ncbi:MAG: hypothetical protein H6581_17660 [Bacteroidia bacterium]|nr:hypothetical protein [Bacteroidia bacterium]
MKIKGLGALIFYSPDPEKFAAFYQEKFGIPFALQRHGNIPEHYECDFEGLHYAVLKRKPGPPVHSVVPSFHVADIEEFLQQTGMQRLHPIMDLGEGSFVCSVNDLDGNMIRLWMNKRFGFPLNS